jgi:hypothetical protein
MLCCAVQECVGYGCEEHHLRFWELLMLNPSGVKVRPRSAAPGVGAVHEWLFDFGGGDW